MDWALAPQLRIVFAGTGLTFIDYAMSVHLDDRLVYRGGSIRGFDLIVPVEVGWHSVSVKLDVALSHLTRKYELFIHAGFGITLLLEFSRWSGFSKTPKLVAWQCGSSWRRPGIVRRGDAGAPNRASASAVRFKLPVSRETRRSRSFVARGLA